MNEVSNYTIIRSQRRTIALHITSDGKLLVKAPIRIHDRQVQKFLEEHAEWIEKKLALVRKRKTLNPVREKGEYFYLGKKVLLTAGDFTSITVKEDKLLFPAGLLFRKEKELTSWYIKEAKRIISHQTEHYAKEMDTEFKEIAFSDTKSQWGRCTHDNRLQFSWRLIMAPILTLNYVVIHELAHTMEKNHTHRFWAVVRRFNPSYRTQIKWLKDHGASLSVK